MEGCRAEYAPKAIPVKADPKAIDQRVARGKAYRATARRGDM